MTPNPSSTPSPFPRGLGHGSSKVPVLAMADLTSRGAEARLPDRVMMVRVAEEVVAPRPESAPVWGWWMEEPSSGARCVAEQPSPAPEADESPRPARLHPHPPLAAVAAAQRGAAPRPGILLQTRLNFGRSALTACPQCGMHYGPGERDVNPHKSFHEAATKGVPWRLGGARELGELDGNKVVMVGQDSPRAVLSKVREEVWPFVDAALGAPVGGVEASAVEPGLLKTYLVIAQGRVAACAIVEPIRHALRVQEQGEADGGAAGGLAVVVSDTPEPAACGVSRLWVGRHLRRKRVAERLLDLVRATFWIVGEVPRASMAFSSPSEDGRRFAEKYFATKRFLVYRKDVVSL